MSNLVLPMIQYLGLDYDTIVNAVKEYIINNPNYNSNWTEITEGDAGRMLIDVFSWIADNIGTRIDWAMNENFPSTAELEASKLKILRFLGESPDVAVSAEVPVTLTLDRELSGIDGFYITPALTATDSFVPFSITGKNTSGSSTTYESLYYNTVTQKFNYTSGNYVSFINSFGSKITEKEDVLFYEGTTYTDSVTVDVDDGYVYTIGNQNVDARSVAVYKVESGSLVELLEVKTFLSYESQNTLNYDGITALPITYKMFVDDEKSVSLQFPTIEFVQDEDKRLQKNDELIIVYRVCNGEYGNISDAFINTSKEIIIDDSNTRTITFVNTTSGYSGQNRENTDLAIERVASAVRTQDRAVLASDYDDIIYQKYGVLKSKTYGYNSLKNVSGVTINPQEVWNFILMKKSGWDSIDPSDYNSFTWFTFLLENRFNEKYSFRDGAFNSINEIENSSISISDGTSIQYGASSGDTKSFKNYYYVTSDEDLKSAISSSFSTGNVRVKVGTTSTSESVFENIDSLEIGKGSFSTDTIAEKLNEVFSVKDANIEAYVTKDVINDYLWIVDTTVSSSGITTRYPFNPGTKSLFSYSSPSTIDGLIVSTSPTTVAYKAAGQGSFEFDPGISDWTTINFPAATYYFRARVSNSGLEQAQTFSWAHSSGKQTLSGVVEELNAIATLSTYLTFSVSESNIKVTAVSSGSDPYIYDYGTVNTSFIQVAQLEKINVISSVVQYAGLKYTIPLSGGLRTSLTSGDFVFKISRNGSVVDSGKNISVFIPKTSSEDTERELNYTTQYEEVDIQPTISTNEFAVADLPATQIIKINVDNRGWLEIDTSSYDSSLSTIATRINDVVNNSYLYNGDGEYETFNNMFIESTEDTSLWPGTAWPYDRFFMGGGTGIADTTKTNAIVSSIPAFPTSGDYKFRVKINGSTTKTYTVTAVSGMTWESLRTRINEEIDGDYLYCNYLDLADEDGTSTGYFDLIIRSKNYDKVQSVEVLECSGACGNSLLGSLGFTSRVTGIDPVESYGDYSNVCTVSGSRLIFTSPSSGSTASIQISNEGTNNIAQSILFLDVYDFSENSDLLTVHGTKSMYLIMNSSLDNYQDVLIENSSPIVGDSSKYNYLHYIINDSFDVNLGTYYTDNFDELDPLYKPYAKRIYNTVTEGTLGTVDFEESDFQVKFTQSETTASDLDDIASLSISAATETPRVGNALTFTDASSISGITYSLRVNIDGLEEYYNNSITVSGATFTAQLTGLKTTINSALQTAFAEYGSRYTSYEYFDYEVDGSNIIPIFSSPTLNDRSTDSGSITDGKITVRKVGGTDNTSIIEALFDLDFYPASWEYTYYADGDFYYYKNTDLDVMSIRKIPGSSCPDGKFYAHFVDDRRAYDYNGETNFQVDEDSFSDYLDDYRMIGVSSIFKKTSFKTFDLEVDVYYDKKFNKTAVQSSIMEKMQEVYGIDNRNYWEPVNKSKIIQTLHSVDGVDFVIVQKFGENLLTATSTIDSITASYDEIIILHENETNDSGIQIHGIKVNLYVSTDYSR